MSSSPQIKDVKPVHPLVAVTTNYIKYLHENGNSTPYLDENDLAALQIERYKIDIDTGKPEDAGLQFTKPRPLDEMRAIAEATKDELLEADFLGQPIEIPGEQIRWKLYNQGPLPDTISYVANEAPLEEGKLLRSEIFCILRMTRAKLKQPRFCSHEIAPVSFQIPPPYSELFISYLMQFKATLVSCSHKDLRIVQGYVHGDGRVVVRTSPIINVDGEEAQNLHDLLRIGAWFFGSPCRVESTLKDGHN
ncbi:uncharacterized protein F4812DRAFT_459676 [Daldinia caldariorum]|uniref:uncharacterized protein n=1 Tax=Daldinia caldariorum TaxID=326644 RepID=UPI002008208E|nr:uncharacterized protein F4812DRAFT_459676 [Daldinia caldariorum]KAI1467567.1 hypothetical protein F4812DRAFT_459676 [Daldinia caldariorum]